MPVSHFFILPSKAGRTLFNTRFYTVGVPIHYAQYTKIKDQVDLASSMYSNFKDIGTISDSFLATPDDQKELETLDCPEGCIFEDVDGVPLMIIFTRLQSADLQVS
jgi:hypothetical protein